MNFAGLTEKLPELTTIAGEREDVGAKCTGRRYRYLRPRRSDAGRQAHRYASTLSCGRLQPKRPAHRLDPHNQRAQPDMSFGDTAVEGRRVEADTVVCDREINAIVIPAQRDPHRGRLGVLVRVDKELTRCAVQQR